MEYSLYLWDDVEMVDAIYFAEKSLVGRTKQWKSILDTILAWWDQYISPTVFDVHNFVLMGKGWIQLFFKSKEDGTHIFKEFWAMIPPCHL